MCENRHSLWEVATTATVTVFGRCGKRLLTIYLAYGPEFGQSTMSRQLTVLITDLLDLWDGPLPTLAYISDSGSSETSYFEDVLRRMRHPRTGASSPTAQSDCFIPTGKRQIKPQNCRVTAHQPDRIQWQ